MDYGLNSCRRCGKEIRLNHIGFYRLNEATDRFELECEDCYSIGEVTFGAGVRFVGSYPKLKISMDS